MTPPKDPSASCFHSYALLRCVLMLASGIGLGFQFSEPAISAEVSSSPGASASSAAPNGAPSALEEAHAAKRAATSYWSADALPKAAASWTQSAQAYERAGNFGEAALAWTEAASLHEQQHEPQRQVRALIHLGYALQQVGQHHKAIVALQAARRIAEQGHNIGLLAASLGQLGKASAALGNDGISLQFFNDAPDARETRGTLPPGGCAAE